MAELDVAQEEFLLKRTKAELQQFFHTLRVPFQPVNTIADVLAADHLQSRGFWTRVMTGEGEAIKVPAPVVRLPESLGAETAVALPPLLPSATLPLAGIRVVDLTQVWAGPLCVQQLADFGAEVIKVDARSRTSTLGGLLPPPDVEPTAAAFSTLTRNRHVQTLDLSRPEGREVLKRLVEVSDVLVENYSSRVMKGWGLDYATLAATNPALIVLSMSPAGHHGPWSEALTYGSSLTGLYGTKSLVGYPGDTAQATSTWRREKPCSPMPSRP
jgi:crotonobetainyl-CoA:carnitine CoA-transferase CaiB-like acyl-CoA transferase